jgi:hypothetical protein
MAQSERATMAAGTAFGDVAHAARQTLGYAEKLLVGIEESKAASFPRFATMPTETVIRTNHPVFVYGHLAIYPARMLEMAGLDPKSVAAPESWTTLFAAGVECEDDRALTKYPRLGEVAKSFMTWQTATIDRLNGLPREAFERETPGERMRASFPTVGVALVFMLNNHVMMHLGQVSAWRRCMGLPPAM